MSRTGNAPPHRNPDRTPYAAEVAKRIRMGIQAFRDGILTAIGKVESGEHVVVMRRNDTLAVLVPIEWYRDVCAKVGDPTDY